MVELAVTAGTGSVPVGSGAGTGVGSGAGVGAGAGVGSTRAADSAERASVA